MLFGYVPHHQVGQPRARRVTFEPVKDQDKNPGGFADHTENVSGSDVAAADGANIDPFCFPHQETCGNGAEQISCNGSEHICANVHARL